MNKKEISLKEDIIEGKQFEAISLSGKKIVYKVTSFRKKKTKNDLVVNDIMVGVLTNGDEEFEIEFLNNGMSKYKDFKLKVI